MPGEAPRAAAPVSLRRLTLTDFRCFQHAVLEPDPLGATVVTGPNGSGKTSLLEAVAYLGLLRSFRGAPREALVRSGCARAVIRAELDDDGSPVLVEAELVPAGRSRAQVNRQPVRSRRELAQAVPLTIFSPEDLGVVQGGPARRRELLDDALRVLDARRAADLDELDRVLRQRAAVLRQAGGRLSAVVADTLAVWDERLAALTDEVTAARASLVAALEPLVDQAYRALAAGEDGAGTPGAPANGGGATAPVIPTDPRRSPATSLAYRRSWDGDFRHALAAARADDLRRATTTVGPHRDDLLVCLEGRDARFEASQGEQRCLALALRLGVDGLVRRRSGRVPILLLDDVFSELDDARSMALVRQLPEGQALVTTATGAPGGARAARIVDVRDVGARRSCGPGGRR